MIQLDNISLQINHQTILKNINFPIKAGEAIGIIGPPGSGKTSLLNIINGLIKNYQGKIIFDKKNAQQLKQKQISFLNINKPLIVMKHIMFICYTRALFLDHQ